MLIPTKRSRRCFICMMPLWILPYGIVWGLLGLLLFFLATLADVVTLPRKRDLVLKRILPKAFYSNEKVTIALEIANLSYRKEHFQLCDDIPPELECENQPLEMNLASHRTVRLDWSVLPKKRGRALFGRTLWRALGRIGLWQREVVVDLTQEIPIFPAKLPSPPRQLSGIGNNDRVGKQLSGQNPGEVDFLRRMRDGEGWKYVDWKQSAAKNEWIVREQKDSIACHIGLFIDCGRRMADLIGTKSRLDYVVDACLQICRGAEKFGDTIALTAFSNSIQVDLPAVHRGQYQGTLRALHDLKTSSGETDYWKVFGKALHRLKKRSLVILFSDLMDSCASKGITYQLSLAAQRHQVVCCLLKDPTLAETAKTENIHRSTAAKYYCVERALAIAKMREHGVVTLELEPKFFHTRVWQHYIEQREKV